jgi:methylated-DNA-protein-cysteine methyltransferase related protein
MTEASESEHLRALYRRIYQVVREIPRGAVATYGQVAELAGIPGGARVAGAAMKTSTPADRLPWQRVIGKAGRLRGRIAIHDPVGAAVQRKLLEGEGVRVGETGLVALDVHGWLAPDTPGRTRRAAVGRAAVGRPAAGTATKASARPRATAGSGRGASPRPPLRSASKRRASSSRR